VLQVMQAKAADLAEAGTDERAGNRDALGRTVIEALAAELPQASWTGIYWQEGRELVLDPFVGAETEHARIPLGRGVCGTAAARGEDDIVDDVATRADYLACDAGVCSELVVLIRSGHAVIGQFDLDAKTRGAFDANDLCVVRAIADAFGALVTPPGSDASAKGA